MHSRVLYQFGRRFVLLSAEASPAIESREAYGELMRRCGKELEKLGLTLENTVRTRLWARTRNDRDAASIQRRELLGDGVRPASSSYVAPGHFLTDASVAVDLVAMEPSHPSAERFHVELDPPISPPRYLRYDGMVFLSGVSAIGGPLEDCVNDCAGRIEASLKMAGVSWQQTVRVASYVQRQHSLSDARKFLLAAASVQAIPMKLESVDGYSAPQKQIEIEFTALK